MIQNVIILKIFFWKYYFGHATFYIWPEVPVDIIRVFFNFRFSSRKYSRKSQSQQKPAHSVQYSFAQKVSLILRNSAYLTLKITATQPKTFLTLNIFQQTCFCLVPAKIFALHHFLTPMNCILEALSSKCLYISLYLLKRIFVPETQ